MNFDEFIKKYLGKKVDFDGYYGGQCVDLYRQYVKDVLNLPQSPSVKGAADIWDTASSEHYDLIKNTPTAIPDIGDVMIWNKNVGDGFGHVAIFLAGNINLFFSLDENWPTLNKVTVTKHNYDNIIGWLHPKKKENIISNVYKGLDLNNKESMKVCVDIWKDVVDRKYIKKEECDKIKEEEIKQLKEDFIKSSQEASIRLTELCNKSLKGKDIQYKNEIKDVLKNAKEDWKVIELQDKVREYEKICQTIAYKVAVAVAKILQALKIIKKEVKNG